MLSLQVKQLAGTEVTPMAGRIFVLPGANVTSRLALKRGSKQQHLPSNLMKSFRQ